LDINGNMNIYTEPIITTNYLYTTDISGYTYYVFGNTGNVGTTGSIQILSTTTVNYLVVGGGGCGGILKNSNNTYSFSGGGGGGVTGGTFTSSSTTTYNITVGAGATGITGFTFVGPTGTGFNVGESSIITDNSSLNITAYGGNYYAFGGAGGGLNTTGYGGNTIGGGTGYLNNFYYDSTTNSIVSSNWYYGSGGAGIPRGSTGGGGGGGNNATSPDGSGTGGCNSSGGGGKVGVNSSIGLPGMNLFGGGAGCGTSTSGNPFNATGNTLNGGSGVVILWFNTPSSTSSLSLTANGIIKATQFNTTSDYRIKENPIPLGDPMINKYTIDVLEPYQYQNKLSNQLNMGLIAHEVQEYFPFLVSGNKDDHVYQSVNYIGLIPLLIHEIKLLKERSKRNKDKIETYKKKLIV